LKIFPVKCLEIGAFSRIVRLFKYIFSEREPFLKRCEAFPQCLCGLYKAFFRRDFLAPVRPWLLLDTLTRKFRRPMIFWMGSFLWDGISFSMRWYSEIWLITLTRAGSNRVLLKGILIYQYLGRFQPARVRVMNHISEYHLI
jgi:hypothetical protein